MIIYKVTNIVNGKVYIGQTTRSLEERKYEHMYATKTNKYEKLTRDYFHKALDKYGENNFIWEILEYCDSKENLDLAEEWYIRYYKSYVGFDNSIGYNLTIGGNGNSGVIFSEEHRKKISESKKGIKLSTDTIEKIKNNAKINPNFGMRGKKCSEETKNKLRLINTGKKHSEETKNKLSKIHKGNKYFSLRSVQGGGKIYPMGDAYRP